MKTWIVFSIDEETIQGRKLYEEIRYAQVLLQKLCKKCPHPKKPFSNTKTRNFTLDTRISFFKNQNWEVFITKPTFYKIEKLIKSQQEWPGGKTLCRSLVTCKGFFCPVVLLLLLCEIGICLWAAENLESSHVSVVCDLKNSDKNSCTFRKNLAILLFHKIFNEFWIKQHGFLLFQIRIHNKICHSPGFGGPWDMLGICFVNVIFITLQKKSFGQKNVWIPDMGSKVPFCQNWKIAKMALLNQCMEFKFFLGQKIILKCPQICYIHVKCRLYS